MGELMREMVCIVCPMGCHMTLENDTQEACGFKVLHNQCPRGKAYAIEEMTAPTRMLTSTVVVEGGLLRRLPVKTAKPIPKALLMAVMKELEQLSVPAPVKVGQVLIKDLQGTGVALVAARSMPSL